MVDSDSVEMFARFQLCFRKCSNIFFQYQVLSVNLWYLRVCRKCRDPVHCAFCGLRACLLLYFVFSPAVWLISSCVLKIVVIVVGGKQDFPCHYTPTDKYSAVFLSPPQLCSNLVISATRRRGTRAWIRPSSRPQKRPSASYRKTLKASSCQWRVRTAASSVFYTFASLDPTNTG